MKPCAKNRKRINWLALDALDARQAREVRAHIEACEGCRHYLEQTSKLTQALKEAQVRTEIETSESFHRSVARAIRAEKPPSLWDVAAAAFRGAPPSWRASLPVLGAMAVAIVILSLLAPRFRLRTVPSPAPPAPRAVSAPGLPSDLPPTLANYRLVANQSLEALDELLTRQGNRPRSPAPIYTASTFALVDPSN